MKSNYVNGYTKSYEILWSHIDVVNLSGRRQKSLKKQVVLLMTDTTRKDMVGCYGNRKMSTPNLDALANEGIRYENAYTCQPVCGPARSAIFTGTFPHSNGMVTNGVPLGANVKTIGQRLSDHGIKCGYVGKWHLDGGDYFGHGCAPEGWDKDYWYDMKCYLDELSEDERLRSRQPEESYKPDFSETFTYAHRCSDRAIKFVNQYRDEDFFLTVSYDEPHGPSLCPAPYNTMYKDFKFESSAKFTDSLSDKPLMQKLWAGDKLNASEDEINHASSGLALFLGCNSFVDYEMGRVLNAIHELIPDAMVIYTSDHGDMLGAHRLFSKNVAIYDEVTNIPLIIKGGEKGKVVTAPASHIDIAPTLMDFFGFPVPKLMEGKSMLPQIHDVSKAINHEVYTEFTRYEIDHDGFGGLQMMRGIVTEDHKLAINLLDKDEFYDRIKDPDEMVNEIDNPLYLDQIHKLHDKLIKHMNDTRDLYRGYQWSLRPWNKGYVPRWDNEGFTRQREDEEYEPRQLDYDTGLPMKEAVRSKYLYEMGDQNDENAK